jgi:hypothetical protein
MSFDEPDLNIMAPQPLSRVNPKATPTFGPDCFDKYPQLSKLVARAINTGAMIETRWSVILVNLMQADPHTGVAMYQALASAEARRAALHAAAKVRLSDPDFLLFMAVVKATTPQRTVRNQFAHHIWGMAHQVKDCLMLAEPEFFTDIVVDAAARTEKVGRVKLILTFPKLDLSKVDVWSQKALETANKEMDEAQQIIIDLTKGINSPEIGRLGEQWQKKLLSRPLISQALARLSKQTAQSSHL